MADVHVVTFAIAAGVLCCAGAEAECPLFGGYGGGFRVIAPPPVGAGSFGVAGAALPDGRLLAVTGDRVFVESEPGAGAWCEGGVLPSPAEPTFVGVSPSGSRIAVGMNPGVVVFDVSDLGVCGGAAPVLSDVGAVFSVEHYDGCWIDEHRLALSAPGGEVIEVVLGTDGALTTRVIVTNIGGASGGVGVDASGNLYTGNGFDLVAGGSETGWVKVFAPVLWETSPVNFESQGVLVCDVLSAVGLRLDAEGNLLVGGGDFVAGDSGYVGVVSAQAIAAALGGGGPANTFDPTQVRKLMPTADPFAFYGAFANAARREIIATTVDFSTSVATWHAAVAARLVGDANGDNVVNFADLNIVLSAFGTLTKGGVAGGDVNGDGRVDFVDLNIVLSDFGRACL